MADGLTNATRLDRARQKRMELVAFAKGRGCHGFTIDDIHKMFGGHRGAVTSFVNYMRISGEIIRLPASQNLKDTSGPTPRVLARYAHRERPEAAYLQRNAEIANHRSTVGAIKYKNVNHCIRVVGHDEDYVPEPTEFPTGAVPGSEEKISILQKRMDDGQDLWHPNDPTCYHNRCEAVL